MDVRCLAYNKYPDNSNRRATSHVVCPQFTAWFFQIPDYYVATPNAVGTVMGALQLVVIGLIRRHNRSLGLPPGGSRADSCCGDTGDCGEGKAGTKAPLTSSDAVVAAAGAAPTLTSGCSTASEGGLEGGSGSGSGGDSKRSSAVGEELVGVQVDNAADPTDAAPEAV